MSIITDLIVLAVALLFIYIFVSLLIRDAKNKKLKAAINNDGVAVLGTITNLRSRSGGNSGFINISVDFNHVSEKGESLAGQSDIVIDITRIQYFQPGNTLPLRYLRQQPQRVLVDLPNPMLKRS
jgi:predicted membrane protein